MGITSFHRIDRVGSEQEAVQKLIIPQPLAYDFPYKTTPNFSTLSSIAPSGAEVKSAPLRPELPLPSSTTEPETLRHFFLYVIELHNTVEECFGKHLDFISQQIRTDMAELERLGEIKTEEVKKYARTVQDQDTWSFFNSTAKYFTYAFSLVLGSALVLTGVGAMAGYFLIAAGGLGLISDKHIWESVIAYFTKSREMQEKVAGLVSGSFVLLSTGFGLAGGVATIHCNGFYLLNAALGTKNIVEKVTVTLGVAAAGLKWRESWANKQMIDTAAALKLTDGEMFHLRKNLLQNSGEAKKFVETMKLLTEQTKQALLI